MGKWGHRLCCKGLGWSWLDRNVIYKYSPFTITTVVTFSIVSVNNCFLRTAQVQELSSAFKNVTIHMRHSLLSISNNLNIVKQEWIFYLLFMLNWDIIVNKVCLCDLSVRFYASFPMEKRAVFLALMRRKCPWKSWHHSSPAIKPPPWQENPKSSSYKRVKMKASRRTRINPWSHLLVVNTMARCL